MTIIMTFAPRHLAKPLSHSQRAKRLKRSVYSCDCGDFFFNSGKMKSSEKRRKRKTGWSLTIYLTCFNFRPTITYQSLTIWNIFCMLISKIINVLSSVWTHLSRNEKTFNKTAVRSKVTHQWLVILNAMKDCCLFMKYYISSIWKNLKSVNVTFNLRNFNIQTHIC